MDTALVFCIVAFVGLLLSLYALRVENKKGLSPEYSPFCDFLPSVSCSRAFLSDEGHTLGFPNAIIGVLYYPAVAILALIDATKLLYLTIPAMLMTLYFAQLLYGKQKNFCLVCTAIYLVNITLLLLSI